MKPKSTAKSFLYGWEIPVILLAVALSGCSKPQPQQSTQPNLQEDYQQERIAKDQAFKSGETSPIREQARSTFQGLSYYPVDPRLRFSSKLQRYPVPKRIRLATNTGEIRPALRYGYFDFKVEGQACQLQAYRLEDATEGGASLFIPFRDATSGQETYASGRYLDLKENTSGIYDLDFNRAYNPYCAYNSDFSCPIPPAENTLAVPIRAGEKNFASAPVH